MNKTQSNGIIKMHRLIMGIEDSNIEVDHKNNIKHDNRRDNLRTCNHSQNQMNKPKPKHNTSGVKGVSWHKATGKWRVRITKDKVEHFLGLFDDFNEAVKIRKAVEEEYFGEFNYKG